MCIKIEIHAHQIISTRSRKTRRRSCWKNACWIMCQTQPVLYWKVFTWPVTHNARVTQKITRATKQAHRASIVTATPQRVVTPAESPKTCLVTTYQSRLVVSDGHRRCEHAQECTVLPDQVVIPSQKEHSTVTGKQDVAKRPVVLAAISNTEATEWPLGGAKRKCDEGCIYASNCNFTIVVSRRRGAS